MTLAAATADPLGFVADLPERTILDEVQRAPGIFTALKSAVDRRRTPGRFLLTGSANVLLVPKLADSLAGRMEILRLHPLSQAEILGREPDFLRALFGGGFKTGAYERLGHRLAEIVATGGYPAALARGTARRRGAWYRDYVETLIQRDVRDLARIRSLDTLPRLLALAAGQTASLINVSDLAGPFQVSRPTIREYVTLSHGSFFWRNCPPGTQPPEASGEDAEAPPCGHRPRLRPSWPRREGALGGPNVFGSTVGDVRVPGATSSGELARRTHPLPPFPRQGRGGGGHRT